MLHYGEILQAHQVGACNPDKLRVESTAPERVISLFCTDHRQVIDSLLINATG